jgi:hypothetical protein
MTRSRRIWPTALALIGAAGILAAATTGQAPAAVNLPPKPANAVVVVVNKCPGNNGSNQLTNEQFNAMAGSHGELMSSLGAVQQYIKPELGPSQGTRLAGVDLANPSSVFGSVGIGGPWNQQTVYVEATGSPADLQRHADALTLLVPRPDRVVVCPTALSEGARRAIADDLRITYSGKDPHFYWAPILPSGKVGVQLRSDGEALATQLSQKYGERIEIWLGHFRWPDRNAGAASTADAAGAAAVVKQTCSAPVPTTLPKLQWRLPKTLSVRSGESFVVPYQFRSPKVRVEVPPFRVVITDLSGKRVVAASSRQSRYTLSIDSLQPNVWRDREVSGATDSCDPAAGWKLPPGSYLAVIVAATTSRSPVDWTSPPVRLTVVS